MLSKSKPARYQKYPSKVAGVHLLNTTANVFVFPYDPTLLSSQRFLLPSSARYLRPLLEVPRLATSVASHVQLTRKVQTVRQIRDDREMNPKYIDGHRALPSL
ncbi:hypothetical protein E4U11_001699 [Claviceps purpurea]|nr:hypothetical protein E4U11_001699 [Claviceps purpurea]